MLQASALINIGSFQLSPLISTYMTYRCCKNWTGPAMSNVSEIRLTLVWIRLQVCFCLNVYTWFRFILQSGPFRKRSRPSAMRFIGISATFWKRSVEFPVCLWTPTIHCLESLFKEAAPNNYNAIFTHHLFFYFFIFILMEKLQNSLSKYQPCLQNVTWQLRFVIEIDLLLVRSDVLSLLYSQVRHVGWIRCSVFSLNAPSTSAN